VLDRFERMQTQVLGLSVDSVPCLKAWAESLGGITYPLLSDFYPHGQVAQAYGVLRSDGRSERVIFVIDKQGIIRYVDVHDIATQPDNDLLFNILAEIEPQVAGGKMVVEPPPAPEPNADVVMYCTPWCPACRLARVYLQEHSINYVEVDISKDRTAARRIREWASGNETTPTFNIKGKIIVDYDRSKLDQALKG
jgi:glutaredoxin